MSEPISASSAATTPSRAPQRAPSSGQHTAAQRTAAPATRSDSSAEPIAIPRGGNFVGLLSFRGAASVLGALRGNIRASGELRIGPDARVEARIEVDEVVIEGWVRGDVVATRRVELAATANVEGAIHAPRIQLREGCCFTGRCESGEISETLDLPA